ncbi:MAG: RdgB/HAM1 family non-canonical purine NTP pyrophosphatase [Bacteroidales bacterium]|nr:RdgB/HAM1 family non-canonical purine NTP pyrophosphatase [Bacteroidales bacterium]
MGKYCVEKALVFATHNAHKLKEVQALLTLPVQGLAELGCTEDIPETGFTLRENAFQKAMYVYERYGVPCFADDTGLEVPALGGAPGVYTARYAFLPDDFEARMMAGDRRVLAELHAAETAPDAPETPQPTFAQNMERLLHQMRGLEGPRRRAAFITVICLIEADGQPRYFEGREEGEILNAPTGAEGFGYDPVFKPEGFDRSFAELNLETKNRISHRGRAVAALQQYLNNAAR